MFETLDKLPKPDIILASPPCESWSCASGVQDGNTSWYTETQTNLLGVMKATNQFTIRRKEQILKNNETSAFKKHWWKAFYSRVNGELCAFNTSQIIERYSPNYWVIENPQSSKVWNYLEVIHGFSGYINVAHYLAYDKAFSKKPTTFMSNVRLALETTREKGEVTLIKRDDRKSVDGYNNRSNIPQGLIKSILEQLLQKMANKTEE